jgi:hypothetical protein
VSHGPWIRPPRPFLLSGGPFPPGRCKLRKPSRRTARPVRHACRLGLLEAMAEDGGVTLAYPDSVG